MIHKQWQILVSVVIRLLIALLISVSLSLPTYAGESGAAVGSITSNDAVSTLTPAPFPPSGHFETAFLPGGVIQASNTGVLFLCGSWNDGLFRSNDGGYMWEALSDPAYYAYEQVLAVSPGFDQDNTLFVGLDYSTNAILLSSDGGRSWRSPQQPAPGQIRDIAVSPAFTADRTVYAASSTYSERRLLRSTDGGEHWQIINNPPRDSRTEQIILSPYFATDQALFVRLLDSTLWRSSDGGTTWNRADNGLGTETGTLVYDLDITALGEGNPALFAATSTGLVNTFDGGQTWHVIDGTVFTKIAIPLDFTSTTIFGIEEDFGWLLRSVDSGQSWTELLSNNSVSDVALAPNYDGTVYTRNSATFWVSHNQGDSWMVASSRPPVSTVYNNDRFRVAASPDFDSDSVVFASPDHKDSANWILKSTDSGHSWSVIQLPQASHKLPLAVSPNFTNDQTVFVAIGNQLYKSTNGGNQWSPLGPAQSFGIDLLQVSPNYANDQTLFIGSYGNGVHRSTDSGSTWTFLTVTGPSYVTDLDISPGYPSDPTLFVVDYNELIYRSDDGGATWTHLSKPDSVPDCIVELSPAFPTDGTLFVGVSGSSRGGAYRSNDRGESWVDITDGVLDYYVTAVAVSPRFAQDQTVIMGRESGPLYISEDAGLTWFPLQGIPTVGAYGRKYGLTIAYEDGFLTPLASTPDAVYRYCWPKGLSVSPPLVSFDFEPGSADPVDAQLHLESDDTASVPWEVHEDAGWLTIAPVSGTLPATLKLTADPSEFTNTVSTELIVHVYWSTQQTETVTVPVCAFFVHHQIWLPVVMRQETS